MSSSVDRKYGTYTSRELTVVADQMGPERNKESLSQAWGFWAEPDIECSKKHQTCSIELDLVLLLDKGDPELN